MADSTSGWPAGGPSDRHSAIAHDIADLRRLMAFVEQRRTQVSPAGRTAADAESLLAKLQQGLAQAQQYASQ